MEISKHDLFLVSVMVIVQNEKGEVLIGKRIRKCHLFFGYYEFPGGKLEKKDKSLKSAAIREVKEESNLDVSNLKLVGVKYYPHSTENLYAGISVCFKTKKFTGELQNLESSNLTFMKPKEALKLKLLPWVRHFLENYQNGGS